MISFVIGCVFLLAVVGGRGKRSASIPLVPLFTTKLTGLALEKAAANWRPVRLFQDDVFAPPGQQSYTLDHRKVGPSDTLEAVCLERVSLFMLPSVSKVPSMNGQMGPAGRPQMSQASMARHPSREQLIDYLMLKVSQPPPAAPRGPQDAAQQEVSAQQKQKNPCRSGILCQWLTQACRLVCFRSA